MIDIPRPPSPSDVERFRTDGWWKDQTFSEILESRARETPAREALCDALRVEGSAELRRAVEDDAGLLIELVQTCETLEEIIDRLESEAAIAAA